MKRILGRRAWKFISLGIGLVVIALVLGSRFWLNTNGNVVYAFEGNLFGAPAGPHQVVAFGYTFQNRSGRTLSLDSVSFPHGIPAHLQVAGELAAYGSKRAMGTYGWPPRTLVGPIHGYSVAPHGYVNILIAVSAAASGVYLVGPVSLHARYPITLTSVPVQVTNTEGRVLCVNVPPKACESRATATVRGDG